MQIATFKAVVARRINKRGCEDCKNFLKKIIKILSHEWSLRALSVRNAFYKIVKAKSQRASRLHSCESIFIIFFKKFLQSSHPLLLILRTTTALNVAICMIFLIFSLIMES